MPFAPDELTHDGFLGGALQVAQPANGYRAATDPVLLAASVAAAPGDKVLELGCGVGVAALCLGCRISRLSLTGVEIQPDYADLARQNSRTNEIGIQVVTADIAELPMPLSRSTFDHILANPPYYRAGQGTRAANPGRDRALHEQTPLAVWLDVAARRLRPRGRLWMIGLSERLPEMLAGLGEDMGSVEILPVVARAGKPAGRVILTARKSGRAPFRLHSPLVMHEGAQHAGDRDSYTGLIRSVLRDGAGLGAWSVAGAQ